MTQYSRLQRLWDAKLLTMFWQRPLSNIGRMGKDFREAHNLSEDEFFALSRTPKVGPYFIKADVYLFLARNIPALYNIAEPRQEEDLFDVLAWIQKQDPQTAMKSKDYDIARLGTPTPSDQKPTPAQETAD